MAIEGVRGFNSITQSLFETSKLTAEENKSVGFASFLSEAINKVNDMQLESSQATDDFIAGRIDNIHQVQIAGERAEVALQFTMQIRNKILEAYNEIMRVQI